MRKNFFDYAAPTVTVAALIVIWVREGFYWLYPAAIAANLAVLILHIVDEVKHGKTDLDE